MLQSLIKRLHIKQATNKMTTYKASNNVALEYVRDLILERNHLKVRC